MLYHRSVTDDGACMRARSQRKKERGSLCVFMIRKAGGESAFLRTPSCCPKRSATGTAGCSTLPPFRRTAKRFAARSIRAVTASPVGKSGRPSAPIVQSLACVPAWMRCGIPKASTRRLTSPSRPARTVNMNTALSSPTTWNILPAGNCGACSGDMTKSACTSLRPFRSKSSKRAAATMRRMSRTQGAICTANIGK